VVVDREQPGGGPAEAAEAAQAQQPPSQPPPAQLPPDKPALMPARIIKITTAIAAGDRLVRLEGRIPAMRRRRSKRPYSRLDEA
jgi:hypothetical protein